MSGKLRVAIVGCGGMGNEHARAWQAHQRTAVVTCADIVPERAAECLRAGARGIAGASAIMGAPHVKTTVRAFREAGRAVLGREPGFSVSPGSDDQKCVI